MRTLVELEAPPEVIEKARREAADTDFELWEDNLPAYQFFCSLRTQWQYVGGMSGMVPTGLDYSAVLAKLAFEVPGRIRQRKLFARLCLMEAAALEVMLQALENRT